MKSIIRSILAAGFMLAPLRAEEVVTLFNVLPNNGPSQTITLEAGDCAEAVYCTMTENSLIRVTIGTVTRDLPLWKKTAAGYPDTLQPVKIAGPATFFLYDGAPALATVKITRAGTPTVTPSNAVVIPSDAAGIFNVILESSTDMITWAAALPGTYSGATEKRFFRTRIVKQ